MIVAGDITHCYVFPRVLEHIDLWRIRCFVPVALSLLLAHRTSSFLRSFLALSQVSLFPFSGRLRTSQSMAPFVSCWVQHLRFGLSVLLALGVSGCALETSGHQERREVDKALLSLLGGQSQLLLEWVCFFRTAWPSCWWKKMTQFYFYLLLYSLVDKSSKHFLFEKAHGIRCYT